MSFRSKNTKTIKQAFSRLKQSEEETALNGMIELLQASVAEALAQHDNAHQHHLQSKDTYGWALFHNNKLVEIEVDGKRGVTGHIRTKFLTKVIQIYDAGTDSGFTLSEGHTYSRLRDSDAPDYGWFGIVMAGMKAGALYFSVDYEQEVLHRTIAVLKTELFPAIFNPE